MKKKLTTGDLSYSSGEKAQIETLQTYCYELPP